jgi:hypothetical protein
LKVKENGIEVNGAEFLKLDADTKIFATPILECIAFDLSGIMEKSLKFEQVIKNIEQWLLNSTAHSKINSKC